MSINIFANMPPSTASGNGPSTISYQHECGRQSWYFAEAKKAVADGSALPLEEDSLDKLDGRRVGTCFHWLALLRPDVSELSHHEDWDNEQVEAVRCYKAALKFGYFDHWRSITKEYWLSNGKTPDEVEYLTGQLDALAEVTKDGWLGLSKGDLIIMDYKTAAKKYGRSYYVNSAQAHAYVQLAHKHGHDVKAFVFGEIARNKTITEDSLSYHMNHGPFWPLPIIEQWAADGRANFLAKRRNLGVCKGQGIYGKPCPFLVQCMSDSNDELQNKL